MTGPISRSDSPPSSRLRGLMCERDLVRPRPRSLSPGRGRIVPVGRPMRGVRGRGLLDPRRVELMNAGGIASKRGALIKVKGHLVPRCECCLDCAIPCALDKFDEMNCGPCTPRNLLVGVGGVGLCSCEYVSDPPTSPRFGAWAGAIGDVDGTVCASPDGGEPFFLAAQCVYMALLTASVSYYLDKLEPFECTTLADGTSLYCPLIIEVVRADPFTPPLLRGRIRTGGNTAEAELFWGETPFFGWGGGQTYVIDNILTDCGIWPLDTPPFPESTWILGKNGTMIIRACCPV